MTQQNKYVVTEKNVEKVKERSVFLSDEVVLCAQHLRERIAKGKDQNKALAERLVYLCRDLEETIQAVESVF